MHTHTQNSQKHPHLFFFRGTLLSYRIYLLECIIIGVSSFEMTTWIETLTTRERESRASVVDEVPSEAEIGAIYENPAQFLDDLAKQLRTIASRSQHPLYMRMARFCQEFRLVGWEPTQHRDIVHQVLLLEMIATRLIEQPVDTKIERLYIDHFHDIMDVICNFLFNKIANHNRNEEFNSAIWETLTDKWNFIKIRSVGGYNTVKEHVLKTDRLSRSVHYYLCWAVDQEDSIFTLTKQSFCQLIFNSLLNVFPSSNRENHALQLLKKFAIHLIDTQDRESFLYQVISINSMCRSLGDFIIRPDPVWLSETLEILLSYFHVEDEPFLPSIIRGRGQTDTSGDADNGVSLFSADQQGNHLGSTEEVVESHIPSLDSPSPSVYPSSWHPRISGSPSSLDMEFLNVDNRDTGSDFLSMLGYHGMGDGANPVQSSSYVLNPFASTANDSSHGVFFSPNSPIFFDE